MQNFSPRVIRLRDAPIYLGMDKNRFNKEVRPKLKEIPIGAHGIAFDRLDLDSWFEHYKHCCGRPKHRRKLWDAKERQDSTNVENFGMLTKKSVDIDFAKALALSSSKMRKNI